MRKEKVSVIIPAYNEEKTIGSVIKDLLKISQYDLEIIVIDDGSKDATVAHAKKGGATKVVVHKKNQGKGVAFRTGLRYVTGRYVIQIDADGQLIPSELPKLIIPLQDGYDMVLGARYDMSSLFHSEFTSMSKMIGNFFLSLATSIAAQKKIVDVMTGFKSFKKEAVLSLNLNANDFAYEAELVVKAARKKYRIKNVLVSCRKREEGSSNLRSLQHGFSVLKTIVRSSF